MTYCGKPVACVGDIVSCPKCKGTHRILEGAMNPPDSLDGVLKAVEGCKTDCGAVLISVGQDIGFYDGELGLDAASYKTLQAEGIERKKAASKAQAEIIAPSRDTGLALADNDFCLECWLKALEQQRTVMDL
jgi:hypothetical protein